MKRDNDYLREKLLEFESSEDFLIIDPLMMSMSEEQAKLHYHIQLLADAGYLVQTGDSVYRMTSDGHDFLDSVRDEGIWKQTKSAISETGGSVTLEIFKSLAAGFLKKKIEKHTGIEL